MSRWWTRRGRWHPPACLAACLVGAGGLGPAPADAQALRVGTAANAGPTAAPIVPPVTVPALPGLPAVKVKVPDLPAVPLSLGGQPHPSGGSPTGPRRPTTAIRAPRRAAGSHRLAAPPSAPASAPRSPAASPPRRASRAPSAGAPGAGAPVGRPRPAPAVRSRDPRRATSASRARPRRDAASRRDAPSRPAGGLLGALGRSLPLPLPVPDWSKPVIVLLALVALALALRSRLATRRSRRLEGQGHVLRRDLDVMQRALVPVVPRQLGGLVISVAYRPAEGPAAGGDFYDVFALGRERTGVILGDVAGHGRAALARAAQVRYSVRAYVEAGLEPREALRVAGEVLSAESGEGFATVAVGVFDARAHALTYASAGHPPPILRGTAADAPLGACAAPPIGSGLPTGHRQSTVTMGAGALACFFSDGLVEARSGSELLGRRRLTELLTSCAPQPDASTLLERVREAAHTAPDDMAACVIEPTTGFAPAPVWSEELKLVSGTGARARAERLLRACRVPPSEISRALALLERTVADQGGALVRVTHDTATTVTVSGSAGGPAASEPALTDRSAQPIHA